MKKSGSVQPQTVSFGPGRCFFKILIRRHTLKELWFQKRSGLALKQKLSFVVGRYYRQQKQAIKL